MHFISLQKHKAEKHKIVIEPKSGLDVQPICNMTTQPVGGQITAATSNRNRDKNTIQTEVRQSNMAEPVATYEQQQIPMTNSQNITHSNNTGETIKMDPIGLNAASQAETLPMPSLEWDEQIYTVIQGESQAQPLNIHLSQVQAPIYSLGNVMSSSQGMQNTIQVQSLANLAAVTTLSTAGNQVNKTYSVTQHGLSQGIPCSLQTFPIQTMPVESTTMQSTAGQVNTMLQSHVGQVSLLHPASLQSSITNSLVSQSTNSVQATQLSTAIPVKSEPIEFPSAPSQELVTSKNIDIPGSDVSKIIQTSDFSTEPNQIMQTLNIKQDVTEQKPAPLSSLPQPNLQTLIKKSLNRNSVATPISEPKIVQRKMQSIVKQTPIYYTLPNQQSIVKRRVASLRPEKFHCSKCGLAVNSRTALTLHYNSRHLSTNNNKQQNIQVYNIGMANRKSAPKTDATGKHQNNAGIVYL